jgi:hypothetical protein
MAPQFMEKKLKQEYGDNDRAIYGTMNKLGLMKGNKETKKGKLEEKRHEMAKKMRKVGQEIHAKPRKVGQEIYKK